MKGHLISGFQRAAGWAGRRAWRGLLQWQRVWECPRLPQPGLVLRLLVYPSPQTPCRWFGNGISMPLLNLTSARRPCFSSVCGTSALSPMTIVRFVSGVGNLLGFFPTTMALSVQVFSVFSTCEIDVYGKKRKRKKELDLLYKNHYFVCPRAKQLFWEWFAHSSPTPLGLLLAVKVSTRVV